VGDEQADTYLRLLAEAELRCAQRVPYAPDADMSFARPHGEAGISRAVIEASMRQVRWAGAILVAAGALRHGHQEEDADGYQEDTQDIGEVPWRSHLAI
jgi:hypothetical protein